MKRSIIATALIAAAVASSTASGAFILDEGNVLSTERGQMGKFQPYDAEGRATFETPSGSMAPKQEKYKDAALMVDLAYSPVSQRGSGEPGLVPGFGDSVPFVNAMTMILPSGWQQYRDKSMSEKDVPERISFSGGRTWPEVLKQIGDRYALHFHIDWFDKTIMLSKGRVSMASQAGQLRVIPEPSRPSTASTTSAISTTSSSTSSATVFTPSGAVVSSAPVAVKPASTSVAAVSAASTKPAAAPAGGSVGATASKDFAPTSSATPSPASASVASSTHPAAVVASSAPAAVVAPSAPVAVVAPAPVVVAPPKPFVPAIPTWKVGPNDKTIREALKGWTRAAGWTFEPEHWAVPVDIPITAGATFSGDFKTAARQLIGTTELGATPLQPCFYTNRVVRVVPINEVCDPSSR